MADWQTLAALVGALGTFVTLLIFARNDGKRAGELQSIKDDVAEKMGTYNATLTTGLTEIRAEFRRFNDHIDATAIHREEHAEWKGEIHGRVERTEKRVGEQERAHEELRKRVHDVGTSQQKLVGDVRVLEERTAHLKKGA